MRSDNFPGGKNNRLKHSGIRLFAAGITASCAWCILAAATGKQADFPDGYDAVQVAPDSHKVLFENALVRVLEVPIPEVGKPEPMHHHHWPSFFLQWDTGGTTPHIRYHRPDGSVRDIPGRTTPVHPGHWVVKWVDPEPMHSIETIDVGSGQMPPFVRVEVKVPLGK